MTLGRLAVWVFAGALALGGAAAALADDPQPAAVQAIDLTEDAMPRRDDAGDDTEAVDDEGRDDTRTGDATEGTEATGDDAHSSRSAHTDDDSAGETTG